MKKEYKIAVAGTGYVGLSIATLVPHSFYPTLNVLFLTTFTKPFSERTCLSRKFKREEKIRVKDTGWMG